MDNRGRKKKKIITLSDHDNPHIDYASKSINIQCLTWEHASQQENRKIVYVYPLSHKASILHWESELKKGINQNAKSMLSRVKNNTHKNDQERYIYDKYPLHKNLIDHLLYSASSLCSLLNVTKRTGSQYASAITALIKFFANSLENIYDIHDIGEDKQMILYNALSDVKSDFYSGISVKSIAKKIMIYSLRRENISYEALDRPIQHNSHSGKKTRIDYPQEVAVQLLAISAQKIEHVKSKYKEILSWRKEYDNKPFDSLENLAKAFITIPKNFLNKKTKNGKTNSIIRYQQFYEKLSTHIHGVSLLNMEEIELTELAKKGINIDNMDDPFIMSWFLDDILNNYPFNITSNGKGSISDSYLSSYTRWNIEKSLRHFLLDRGQRRKRDFLSTFYEVFSYKYPVAEHVIPFVIFWMLQTGSNPEAIINMKRKEESNNGTVFIGDLSPLGDTPVIRSFKNRGSKNYYWFVLNPHEKNGLYSHFKFLKKFLSPLWAIDDKMNYEKKMKWPFWVYYSPTKTDKVIQLDWSNLNSQLNAFAKNNKIVMPDGTYLETIEPSRFRNTFITMADLNNATIEEIQEWIRHDNFDTRFKFYANSPDQRSRNFRAIHSIQEAIIEDARKFNGEIELSSLTNKISNKEIDSTYLCGCTDIRDPSYTGAKAIPETDICIDWDMCLLCTNSRVFREHLPRICARILQYEEYRQKMTADEWENNFGSKHIVAHDALQRWISDGGEKDDIDDAWKIAKNGDIDLPPLFPAGHLNIKSGSIDAA